MVRPRDWDRRPDDFREQDIADAATPRGTRHNTQRDGEQDERDERLDLPDRVVDVPWR